MLVEKSRFPTGVENVGVGGGRGIGGAGGFSKFDGEGGGLSQYMGGAWEA